MGEVFGDEDFGKGIEDCKVLFPLEFGREEGIWKLSAFFSTRPDAHRFWRGRPPNFNEPVGN